MGARQVLKYAVPHATEGRLVPLPRGARIVHIEAAPSTEEIFAWALCDRDKEIQPRHVAYFATGVPIPDGWVYLGTANALDRGFVWHVFERPVHAEGKGQGRA
jgi:hypothetical protein